MKAIILTEGGGGIGFGHVSRCLAIKQAFEHIGVETRLVINGDKSLSRVLTDSCYTLADWQAGCVSRFLQGIDIVLVDSYLAGEATYKKIADVAKHCIYFDDFNRIKYPVGTVINYSASADEMNYIHRPGIRYLLGASYTPLRKGFWQVSERKILNVVRKALIIFGGTDTSGHTLETLRFLVENYPGIEKKVVIGAGFPFAEQLEQLKDDKTKVFVSLAAEKVKKVMLDCDIAFTAGGVTLCELARTGLPALVVSAAENQVENVKSLVKAHAACSVRIFRGKIDTRILKKTFARITPQATRTHMSNAGKGIVDGQGASRIAKYAISQFLEDAIRLRQAAPGDVLKVFKISNEPDVRGCSINTRKIPLPEHKKWFKAKLTDLSTLFLISEKAGEFVGQVRFVIGEKDATVSISIVRQMRGWGSGKIVLRKALEILATKHPKVKTVLAYIKPENLRSQKLFENLGFIKKEEVVVNGVHLYLYNVSVKNFK